MRALVVCEGRAAYVTHVLGSSTLESHSSHSFIIAVVHLLDYGGVLRARMNWDHPFRVVPGGLGGSRVQKWILHSILPISFLVGQYGQLDQKSSCWGPLWLGPGLGHSGFLGPGNG